ncbi:hypothetical protein ACFRAQ_24140 [Nocardia sp. NPDC056611]|uniref:hypothetical protein n=1 Tax=unclassified Nocardia TaxID=2637762 RepID=UPI00366F463E
MATRRIRQLIIGGAATAATAAAIMTAPAASAQTYGIIFPGGLAHVGTTYNLTVHVAAPNAGTQVGFWVLNPGSSTVVSLGTVPVDSSGNAVLAWSPTAAGTYSFTANDDLTVGPNGGSTLGVQATAVPEGSMGGTGSFSAIPVIGGPLVALMKLMGLV